ncbi:MULTISPECIES: TraR/DksA family transcriptional regulator [Thermomonospora]|uniref:RNA polymerase-binding transcription factor DksA n=1 Tax=Thermomonospora cellulosilytica TaxID=1411118 RepID=A0A7W3RCM7_9ACTN|nr:MULTISPECIES: TraR/DksA C4-type zinc finger protein [Thermomonospora]MBA9007485.1 RNA polymerase-binding transcription factor DksA [Thermomonospora cellulosilytica]
MDPAAARARLEAMLADLDRSIALLTGESGYEVHPADAGSDLSDAQRVAASLEAMRRQRNAVLAALQRIAAGTYGRCVSCRRPVAEGRLEARPDAARCVTCQAAYDRARR